MAISRSLIDVFFAWLVVSLCIFSKWPMLSPILLIISAELLALLVPFSVSFASILIKIRLVTVRSTSKTDGHLYALKMSMVLSASVASNILLFKKQSLIFFNRSFLMETPVLCKFNFLPNEQILIKIKPDHMQHTFNLCKNRQ